MYKLCELATLQLKKNIEETHTIGDIYKDKQRIGNMLVIMRLEAKNSEEPTKSYIIFQQRKKKVKKRKRESKKKKKTLNIYI